MSTPAIVPPPRRIEHRSVWVRTTSRIASWLGRILRAVRKGTNVPWRFTESVDSERRLVVFATRDVPLAERYGDALARTVAELPGDSTGPAAAEHIGKAVASWGRQEFFPLAQYSTGRFRQSGTYYDLCSRVACSRQESEAILDLLAGRQSDGSSASEALVLYDVVTRSRP